MDNNGKGDMKTFEDRQREFSMHKERLPLDLLEGILYTNNGEKVAHATQNSIECTYHAGERLTLPTAMLTLYLLY